MRFFLILLSAPFLLFGILALGAAKGAVHEILAAISLAIFTVLLSAASVISAIQVAAEEIGSAIRENTRHAEQMKNFLRQQTGN